MHCIEQTNATRVQINTNNSSSNITINIKLNCVKLNKFLLQICRNYLCFSFHDTTYEHNRIGTNSGYNGKCHEYKKSNNINESIKMCLNSCKYVELHNSTHYRKIICVVLFKLLTGFFMFMF